MDQQYMARTLSEKVGVSFEEAYKALEECNWDMLDAAIKLEREHDISGKDEQRGFDFEINSDQMRVNKSNQSFEDWLKLVWRWLVWLINASIRNSFNVKMKGELIAEIPILALVALFLLAFWVMFILLVVGLFLGCRYSFTGPDFPKEES